MKIKGYNTTEIANRYYQKLGKNYERNQAKVNFDSLRHPKIHILKDVIQDLYNEAHEFLNKELKKR